MVISYGGESEQNCRCAMVVKQFGVCGCDLFQHIVFKVDFRSEVQVWDCSLNRCSEVSFWTSPLFQQFSNLSNRTIELNKTGLLTGCRCIFLKSDFVITKNLSKAKHKYNC
ncbi:hypothetical protein T08_3795 [Trichinella sp. T8]|nr:hypothetical protein T08_3795 [Trichinella sp. T8]